MTTPPPQKPLTELAMLLWLTMALLAGFVVMAFISGCGSLDSSANWIPMGLGWTYRDKPLLVGWDHAEFDEHNQSMEYAMDAFPCGMYEPAQEGERPDVTLHVVDGSMTCAGITDDEVIGTDKQGYALACKKEKTCQIILRGDTLGKSTTAVYLIVAHELGHCSGLGHNSSTQGFHASIMHPGVINFASNLENGKPLPMFTRTEENMLKGRYCRQVP